MSDRQAPHVYSAIAQVIKALAVTGVAKSQTNKFDGYNFRGIDDVYNALAAKLPEAGLVILPRVMSREAEQRQDRKGNPLFYVTVKVDYDLISTKDGTQHLVSVDAEAMDRSDKATSKALSAAYKAMAFQVFCIPVEGQEDADQETLEVAGTTPEQALADARDSLTAAASLSALSKAWSGLTKEQRQELESVKEARKAELKEAAAPATGGAK